jgi:hypothetical protein
MSSRDEGVWIMVDPGTWSHGVVVIADGVVVHANHAESLDNLHLTLRHTQYGTVLVERVQAHGMAGNDVMLTCEHSADFRRLAIESGHDTHRIYRRHVKQALDVRGKSSDAIIRARLCEEFGASAFDNGKACPKRKNKSHGDDCAICGGSGMEREPGRFAGVKSHAIQALALWLAFDHGAREVVHERPKKGKR